MRARTATDAKIHHKKNEYKELLDAAKKSSKTKAKRAQLEQLGVIALKHGIHTPGGASKPECVVRGVILDSKRGARFAS